ncbi:MAG: hypothetical protein R6X32_20155 [Chloroflexota bacterium]
MARIPGETGGADLIGDRQDHGPPVPPLHYTAVRVGRHRYQPIVRAGRRGNQPRPHQPTPARAVSPPYTAVSRARQARQASLVTARIITRLYHLYHTTLWPRCGHSVGI